MAAYTVDKTIDCKGLSCPMPIIRTKKAVEELQAGEVLEVVATDPGSVADVKSWAVRTGHQFLGTVKEDGVFKHYIRKSHSDEVKTEKRFPYSASHDELMGKLKANPVILDVRESMEYAFGHIPGAKLVPFGKLEETIDQLRQHQNEDVYVICRTGSRSDMACQVLSEHGFTGVRNVLPGMAVWTGPTEKETK
ncbi:sulfurtransferase TusA family protein [Aneurinibacillus sp. Ricciae_BoGa-3]|uniref:sulfurtransferase TusA family protein n=1 Tax=Aneurinibacillus sp. Ricciae_BoGa-3 TaxID=3022697 RepID=UPI00233FFEFE|nr:sulfurtransferase TusA family protein [Aneurinibacillus sp. Ricciae_BoGa-3]WCK56487.1 sulfurtransferase TusA family protein [Aneurinibacillus sp. Ricciae_BoGa-3]